MSDFILDGTTDSGSLDFPKMNRFEPSIGADSSKYIDATDWNALNQAVVDIRKNVISGSLFGFGYQFATGTLVNEVQGTNLSSLDFIYARPDGTLAFHRRSGGEVSFTPPFKENVGVTGSLEVSGTLRILNQITGSLRIVGPVQITGSVGLTGSMTLVSNVQITGSIGTTGMARVVGPGEVTGSFAVTGSLQSVGPVQVTGTIRTTGAIFGPFGNSLANDSSGFWRAEGFQATSTSNGFRFSGGSTLSHGGNTGLNISDAQAITLRSSAAVSTSGNTPTNLGVAYTPADGDAIVGTAYVGGKNSDTVGCGYVIHFAGRKSGGTCTLIGAVATALTAEDAALAAASATVVASGGTFVIQVTGVAATNISWDGFMIVNVAN